jgi:hypothetical protein
MRRPLLTAVTAAALVLVSCSSPAEPDAAPQPTTPAPTPTQQPTWPLTGLPATDEVKGPVVVVKVDNTASAFPQVGLDSADLVVEQVVEGGVTRLAVMLQSQLADLDDDELTLGPVRSVRSSDVGIVKPTGGVLVASGGAPPALADIEQAGIETRLEGSAGFFRDASRFAPYNLFVDVAEVREDVGRAGSPDDYLPFDSDARLPQGNRADTLLLQFSAAHTTTMQRDGRVWRRAGVDDGYEADTVIALTLQTVDAGYLDPGGNPVPELVTTGSGRGWVAHGSRVTRVTWSKASADAPWQLEKGGEQLMIPPGHVYLALMPVTTAAVTTQRGS